MSALEEGKLKVLTRYGSTTYYEDRDGRLAGIEHDLAEKFAQFKDLELEFILKDSVDDVIKGLQRGEGHIAAAGLTKTKKRSKQFLSSPSYQTIKQEVVCHKSVKIKDLEDLIGKTILVISNSSYTERLSKLQQKEKLSDLDWSTSDKLATEQIFQLVWEKKVNCTIADTNIFNVHRRYFPDLRNPISISDEQELVWFMPKEEVALQKVVESWFEKMESEDKLTALKDFYYGYVDDFDLYDTQVFLKRIEERLPKYVDLFKKAAEKYKFDWKFLAAMAYQESHWNPKAKSPTGVRGIMMLTQPTAKSLGVTNRLDPEQSIMGGAAYLRRVMGKFPSFIPEEDRKWMAIASYNVGYYHLRDARSIAVIKEKNPNRWSDVKSVLPLLSRRKYYKRLMHGYARGVEPVVYVERIRNYYDLLTKVLNKRKPAQKELRQRKSQ